MLRCDSEVMPLAPFSTPGIGSRLSVCGIAESYEALFFLIINSIVDDSCREVVSVAVYVHVEDTILGIFLNTTDLCLKGSSPVFGIMITPWSMISIRALRVSHLHKSSAI